jgi:hypothetical protein
MNADEDLDVLFLTETLHESDSVSIRRLRAENLHVLERARPQTASSKVDSLSYVNHGGVAIAASQNIQLTRLNTCKVKTF